MLNADDLRFFVAITQSSSLAAAARRLNVTPPAVTQRLRSLELRLGVQLVDRSTNSMTDEGELLAEQSRKIVDQIDEISELLAQRRGTVAGHLRISAPSGFGRTYIVPTIDRFLESHPEVRVTLELSDNPIGLKSDAWDVIIHIGELRPSPLQMIQLSPNRRLICASPAYLARHGTPQTPTDLLKHDCLGLRENDEDVTLWRFARADGSNETVRVNPLFWSNDGEAIRELAVRGKGIMLRSEWDVAGHIATGTLVEILQGWSAPDAPVVALLGPRNYRAARTRNFVDLLRQRLTPTPWRSP
ncbi:LysR family transcriptional regulator [Bosea psychrotolerans]|nr:LysR family transcriptional regulator [Bosea psychrotolerans]